MELFTCLETLCAAPGVGGMTEIRDTAANLLTEYVDEVRIDALGNVIGIRYGTDKNAPATMLEAHMDEIGMVVTAIEDGFIRMAPCGGVDARVLSTADVVVYGDKPYNGTVVSTPPHLSDAKERDKCDDVTKLSIDIGMTDEQAKEHVAVGSRIAFRPHFDRVGQHAVCSKALDDRAGMAALLLCAQTLKDQPCANTVVYIFTVQEELGCRGAAVAAYDLPAIAKGIAVDVSFGYTPDADRNECGNIGDGPMIGISPILDMEITDTLKQLAKRDNIPHQLEVMGESTGTNADRLTLTKNGIPCGLVSVPLRYMHTPQELIDLRDVEQTAALLAAFVQEGTR